MAYKFRKGKAGLSGSMTTDDIAYFYDTDTKLDWDQDYISLVAGGTDVLVVSGTTVGIGTTSPEAYLDIKNTTDDGGANRTMIRLHNYRDDDADQNDWASTSIDFRIENVEGGLKGATARIATVLAPSGSEHNSTEGERSSGLIFSTMDNNTLSESLRIDHSGSVGIGTTEPTSTLSVTGSVSKSIAKVTGTTNAIGAAHHTILMGHDDSDCFVQLPSASKCTGRIYIFKRLASGDVKARITPDGSETIDDESGSWELDTQYNILSIQSDGSKWWIIGEVHMGDGG